MSRENEPRDSRRRRTSFSRPSGAANPRPTWRANDPQLYIQLPLFGVNPKRRTVEDASISEIQCRSIAVENANAVAMHLLPHKLKLSTALWARFVSPLERDAVIDYDEWNHSVSKDDALSLVVNMYKASLLTIFKYINRNKCQFTDSDPSKNFIIFFTIIINIF